MSEELEAAGALTTAGLAAKVIDGHASSEAGSGECINCNAALSGKFCANCGQPAHVHRSLGHLVEEAVHGILHFDGRFWRTLPKLVVRPGTLTRDYMTGRRARFISPLAAFLFTIFLMFFVFSLTGGAPTSGLVADGGVAISVGEAETLKADSEAELAAAKQELIDAGVFADQAAADAALDVNGEFITSVASGKSWQEQWIEAVERGDVKIGIGDAAFQEKIKKKLLNPDLLIYKLTNTAYKFSFLLVPLSLPFVALMFFWKRELTLFDHGVFVLYSLTFMSLLLVVMALVLKVPGDALGFLMPILVLTPPVHMFFHLKGAYALGWPSALWRTVILLISSFLCLSLFAAAILAILLLG